MRIAIDILPKGLIREPNRVAEVVGVLARIAIAESDLRFYLLARHLRLDKGIGDIDRTAPRKNRCLDQATLPRIPDRVGEILKPIAHETEGDIELLTELQGVGGAGGVAVPRIPDPHPNLVYLPRLDRLGDIDIKLCVGVLIEAAENSVDHHGGIEVVAGKGQDIARPQVLGRKLNTGAVPEPVRKGKVGAGDILIRRHRYRAPLRVRRQCRLHWLGDIKRGELLVGPADLPVPCQGQRHACSPSSRVLGVGKGAKYLRPRPAITVGLMVLAGFVLTVGVPVAGHEAQSIRRVENALLGLFRKANLQCVWPRCQRLRTQLEPRHLVPCLDSHEVRGECFGGDTLPGTPIEPPVEGGTGELIANSVPEGIGLVGGNGHSVAQDRASLREIFFYLVCIYCDL